MKTLFSVTFGVLLVLLTHKLKSLRSLPKMLNRVDEIP